MKTYSLQKHSDYANLYFRYQHFIPKIFRSYIESSILTFSSTGETKPFDLCISLGNYCLPAMILDILNLREYSFPFDWLSSVDLDTNIDWILNDFDGFLSYADLVFPKDINCKDEHIRVHNIKTGISFVHDFTEDSLSEFHTIEEKYKRRCNRLLQSCANKRILFLYVESNPDKFNYKENGEQLLSKLHQAQKKLQAAKVMLVVLYHQRQESGTINVFQTQNSSLYFYGSQKIKIFPMRHKEKLEFALQVKEVLQTIAKQHLTH